MLSKCANPACSAHFLYLREGRIFRIMRDTQTDRKPQMGVDLAMKKHARVEFYWLCDKCAQTMTVCRGKDSGIIVQPLRSALRAAS